MSGKKLYPLMLLVVSVGAFFLQPSFADNPSPVSLNGVFDQDLADVKPAATAAIKDALAKAKPSEDGCYPPPLATVTAGVKGSADTSFDTALGKARAAGLQKTLAGLGYGQDRAKTAYTIGNSDNVEVTYKNSDKDTDPPKLKVTSTPPKGTRVKAGDKIHVTIIASERYADGHKSSPSGVQAIQLTANDGLVDSKDYGKPPQTCARQTLEATYTVPNNPPPVVHLRAIAEDGVGNQGEESADFPAGEKWEGTWHVTGIHDSQRYGSGGNVRHQETFDADVCVLRFGRWHNQRGRACQRRQTAWGSGGVYDHYQPVTL
ncbi:MAG: hypothetical protein ABR611_06660 [Chthoniobacterales bacterium]